MHKTSTRLLRRHTFTMRDMPVRIPSTFSRGRRHLQHHKRATSPIMAAEEIRQLRNEIADIRIEMKQIDRQVGRIWDDVHPFASYVPLSTKNKS